MQTSTHTDSAEREVTFWVVCPWDRQFNLEFRFKRAELDRFVAVRRDVLGYTGAVLCTPDGQYHENVAAVRYIADGETLIAGLAKEFPEFPFLEFRLQQATARCDAVNWG
jgi:hypothetical protein